MIILSYLEWGCNFQDTNFLFNIPFPTMKFLLMRVTWVKYDTRRIYFPIQINHGGNFISPVSNQPTQGLSFSTRYLSSPLPCHFFVSPHLHPSSRIWLCYILFIFFFSFHRPLLLTPFSSLSLFTFSTSKDSTLTLQPHCLFVLLSDFLKFHLGCIYIWLWKPNSKTVFYSLDTRLLNRNWSSDI